MFDGCNNNIMFLYYFLHPYVSKHNNYNVISLSPTNSYYEFRHRRIETKYHSSYKYYYYHYYYTRVKLIQRSTRTAATARASSIHLDVIFSGGFSTRAVIVADTWYKINGHFVKRQMSSTESGVSTAASDIRPVNAQYRSFIYKHV